MTIAVEDRILLKHGAGGRAMRRLIADTFLSAFATDPPGGTQAISQCACSQQSADASSTSTQTKPTNQNISVDVLSPGNTTGPVTQINSSAAASAEIRCAGELRPTAKHAPSHACESSL